MLQFTKLRLSGFKSFVDPTELLIAPGMTGIVGPNGCGKSNLVEALRWVMGETSAKQLRGGEMDDIIFGGTADRPARNIAEVLIQLDNTERSAPAAFNEHEDVDVARRVERAKGSIYRVNGREVRARDVQILFADQATGPRSTALVSQGRVGALINAKPTARRMLLEEAAGITGLHSRRHEAELRLRAAETNLGRLDDVLATLDAQLQGLRKQARQARRYRNISDHVRRSEAIVLHHRWTEACATMDTARERLTEAERLVAEQTRATATATTEREQIAEGLAPLRQAEAAAAAELQRLTLAQGELEAEARRVTDAHAKCEARLRDIGDDLSREEGLVADAAGAVERLASDRAQIEEAQAGEADRAAAAAATLDQATARAAAADRAFTDLTQTIAADDAQHAALTRELADLEARLARLDEHVAMATTELQELEPAAAATSAVDTAAAQLAEARVQLAETAAEFEAAERHRLAVDAQIEAARDARQRATEQLGRHRAEVAALDELLAENDQDGSWPTLLQSTSIDAGYEAALGAALGDDLDAAAATDAPKHWRALPALSPPLPLPEDTPPLSRFVRGHDALSRRLGQVGVVADTESGRRLAEHLAPGQRLVSRAGELWRWDGFTVAAGVPATTTTRLKQRNRRAELAGLMEQAEAAFAEADARFAAAREVANQAAARERAARERQRELDRTLAGARESHDDATRAAAAKAARLQHLRETTERLGGERGDTQTRLTAAREALAALADLADRRAQAATARQDLDAARMAQQTAQADVERLRHAAEDRRRRLTNIEAESATWSQRQIAAGDYVIELRQRQAAAAAELAQLAARPGEIEQQRHQLADTIAAAGAKRSATGDRVAAGETRLAEADRARRAAETAHGEAREQRVRIEAQLTQAGQARQVVRERIAERLTCQPEALLAAGDVPTDKPLPELEAAEQRLERLLRERESMGPVNLRAEQEADELAEQITTMQTERADLLAAIARLRAGIATLNREARQRLMASFTEVDRHFQELFVSLFGGGRCHIGLINSDDPLEAGLEIFASPPGKRLQALSLLSGGEQALTAIALLFAVFLTNPAPICVLDEVDAPLDDANVDRFCTLLESIARNGRTRFLLVTHHRMTMARMDRLYGVTMPERGVSQLVAVDLQGAEAMRQTA